MSLNVILFLLAAAWPPGTAKATTFMARPFPESVQNAPNIVRGEAGTAQVRAQETSSGKRIYTYTEFTIDEVLKGTIRSKQIQVRQLGGEKDGVGMHVPGVAEFSPGEDIVLLLGDAQGDGSFEVRGMMMGKLQVVKGANGEEMLDGPALIDAVGHHDQERQAHDSKPESSGSGHSGKIPIESLRNIIREQGGERPVNPPQPLQTAPPSLSSTSQEGGKLPESGEPRTAEDGSAPAKSFDSLAVLLSLAVMAGIAGLILVRRVRK